MASGPSGTGKRALTHQRAAGLSWTTLLDRVPVVWSSVVRPGYVSGFPAQASSLPWPPRHATRQWRRPANWARQAKTTTHRKEYANMLERVRSFRKIIWVRSAGRQEVRHSVLVLSTGKPVDPGGSWTVRMPGASGSPRSRRPLWTICRRPWRSARLRNSLGTHL